MPVVPTPSLGTASAHKLAGHTSAMRAQELQAHNSAATLLFFALQDVPEQSPDFGLTQTPLHAVHSSEVLIFTRFNRS